ncbi:hypothetical protein F5Y19DRAFT_382246 [Xylariaceae sp. FL1651]|nr:hypothetical protein F5Y19DRAFT_382246 [Xylariaceae sp. FL1651]
MGIITTLRSKRILFGLVALAASANAQGPPFGAQNGWGGYGGNPYDPNNNGGSGNNGDGSGSSSGSSGNSYGSNGASSSSFGFGLSAANAGFDYTSALRYRSIHGVLAAIAFAVLFPLGSIAVRLTPGRHAWLLHGVIQLVAYAVYAAAAGLGLYLVSIVRIPTAAGAGAGAGLLEMASTNAHPIIGIVLLGALFFQPLLGVAHHRRFRKLGARTWVSHAHIWIGRLGLTLGIINGGLGLAISGATGAPVVAYAVIAGVFWVLWLLAALSGEWRLRRAQGKARDDGYVRNVRGAGGAAAPPMQSAAAVGHGHGVGSGGGGGESNLAHPVVPMAGRDIPSPPYTPGPYYEAHVARQPPYNAARDNPHDMRNVKEVMDRSDTVSTLSSQDGMYRGQV